MNPKLSVLYKELPWLRVIAGSIADKIGDPGLVMVKRLDAESITCWTGLNDSSEGMRSVSGYFFDEQGRMISPIAPQKPAGVVEHFRYLVQSLLFKFGECSQKDYITVEDALKQCAVRDRVRYIVLFGWNYGPSVYVYKMPKGTTASQLLDNVKIEREEKVAQKLQAAAVELNEELTQSQ